MLLKYKCIVSGHRNILTLCYSKSKNVSWKYLQGNLSHLGGGDQEDSGLRTEQAKSSWDPSSSQLIKAGCGGMACHPSSASHKWEDRSIDLPNLKARPLTKKHQKQKGLGEEQAVERLPGQQKALRFKPSATKNFKTTFRVISSADRCKCSAS
jgi:hypothetical protein